MHETSMQRMGKFRKSYVLAGQSVLDVGGADVNGSYRKLFQDCDYKTLDLEGADIIVDGWDWPIDNDQFDVVISGQMLEHDKFFWLTLKNIARVLKPGGVVCLIAPMAWRVHRYPVDCWRFQPDASASFAEWMGMELVETEVMVVGAEKSGGKKRDLVTVLRNPSVR